MELPDFSALTPQDVAEAAETVLGERIDGTLTPYPSYINRVYGLRTEEGRRVIAKFYRPGRWSEAALREEQAFVAECADAGLPVLSPIPDQEGETLHAVAVETDPEQTGGDERLFFFAVFPFVRGPRLGTYRRRGLAGVGTTHRGAARGRRTPRIAGPHSHRACSKRPSRP